ncbi:MAG: hypothetical protein V7767_05225 [Leeuwenhoekiella sp.]
MFKKLLNLLWNRASLKTWQLELGAYLLKKGCGYELGQVVRHRKIGHDRYRVKIVTNLFFDFATNKVNHIKENRIISSKDIEAGR